LEPTIGCEICKRKRGDRKKGESKQEGKRWQIIVAGRATKWNGIENGSENKNNRNWRNSKEANEWREKRTLTRQTASSLSTMLSAWWLANNPESPVSSRLVHGALLPFAPFSDCVASSEGRKLINSCVRENKSAGRKVSLLPPASSLSGGTKAKGRRPVVE